MTTDSCAAFDSLRRNADALMADLLDAALAVKAEQNLADDAEAYDYSVSFLSGVYRAFAVAVREPVVAMMGE